MKDLTEEAIAELRIPALAERMFLVRAMVRSAAELCGLDDAATQDLILAVGEACQNVIQHGYAGDATGDIVLSLGRTEEGVVVRVKDFAPPVDPARIKSRDLGDVRPGGLGSLL